MLPQKGDNLSALSQVGKRGSSLQICIICKLATYSSASSDSSLSSFCSSTGLVQLYQISLTQQETDTAQASHMQAFIYQQKHGKPNASPKAAEDAMDGIGGSGYGGGSVVDGQDGDGLNKAQEGAIVYLPPPPAPKGKKQSPQDAIDEFWSKFDSKTPGRGQTIPRTSLHSF
jgi:hypothetical protein